MFFCSPVGRAAVVDKLDLVTDATTALVLGTTQPEGLKNSNLVDVRAAGFSCFKALCALPEPYDMKYLEVVAKVKAAGNKLLAAKLIELD